jgi:cell wall assembly regulator SMI1
MRADGVPEHDANGGVSELWQRIEAKLAALSAGLVERLAPPATEAEIEELERAIGAELPADYKQSLRIHGGFTEMIVDDAILLTPKDVIRHRDWLSQSYASFAVGPHTRFEGPLQHAYYHAGWIPVVAGDEDRALFYCIDTAPTDAGARGQLITMMTNDPDRDVAYTSFTALLADLLLLRLEEHSIDEEALEEDGLVVFE